MTFARRLLTVAGPALGPALGSALVLALMLAALAGCAGPAGNVAERGIGGTGGPALAERGIGGTGLDGGDTAVIGTITGFGSVLMNGLEIASEGISTVDVDGQQQPVSVLKVGQFAHVIARGERTRLEARTIEVDHEASGPVQRILPNGAYIIAGQRVRLLPRTLGDAPNVGDWVEVSGLRNVFGGIMASRIDQRAPGEVTVAGQLVATAHGLRIGGLRVALPPGSAIPAPRVRVTGDLVRNTLVVRLVRPAPVLFARPRLARLIVEAFVQSRDGAIRIGETGTASAGPGLGALPADAPVVLDVTAAPNGTFVATSVRAQETSDGGEGAGTSVAGGVATASHATSAVAATASSAAASGAVGKGAAASGSAASAGHGAASAGAGSGAGHGGGAHK